MQSDASGELRKLMVGSPEKARVAYGGQEIYDTILRLRQVFDLVRLVDPRRNCELSVDERGALTEQPYQRYDIWQREGKRGNSAAVRAMNEHTQITKFEFVDEDLYHITEKYVEVDGRACALEMVSRVTENTLLDGMGKHEIVEAISRHNERMYNDPLTGVRNRRYFEDHFQHTHVLRGVAMLDVDNFKRINDTYGHLVGDRVLRAIGETVTACVRASDAVIRYGGDEFVIIFDGIPKEALSMRTEVIREHVSAIRFEDRQNLRTTVSIGCAYGEDNIANLIERADAAMYLDKASKPDTETRDTACRASE